MRRTLLAAVLAWASAVSAAPVPPRTAAPPVAPMPREAKPKFVVVQAVDSRGRSLLVLVPVDESGETPDVIRVKEPPPGVPYPPWPIPAEVVK